MPRDIDLYNIGSEPENLLSALLDLRRDFDSHQHDGSNSRSFQVLNVETLVARTSVLATTSLSVTKKSYTDDTAGFWVGIHSGVAKLYVGTASNFVKWDGSTLSINGSITATTGTIGGFTIGATSLSTSGVVISSAAVSAASGTIKIDGANNKVYVGSSLTLDGASSGTITGGTIQTASSGSRVAMVGSTSTFNIYDASSLVGQIAASSAGIGLFDGSSVLYAVLTSSGFSLNQGNVVIPTNKAYTWNEVGRVFIDSPSTAEARVASGDLNIASAGKRLKVESVTQPIIYFGYCSGTTISRDNNSFTLTNPSTGNYTITHNLNSSTYTVVATALRASGAGAYIAKIAALNTNSFDVIIFDDTGTVQNGDFMFLLTQL